ncbi:hypothetical protein DPMN_182399 [Dreissena polymorpha]|uniref:Uncharacterized protein n=1 Tax=Dreissena polymorpha TaxID=45954 RepID=A0A9D4DFD8_DREPO|nr:hypothetical protein DPMN_182399 [Dreissena polymorpha]
MTTFFVTVVSMLLIGWLSDVNGTSDPCVNVNCGWPICPDDKRFTIPGRCCSFCTTNACEGINCVAPSCTNGDTPAIKQGDCCPTCP